MSSKRRKGAAFQKFVLFVILPLGGLDLYAFWKVKESSESWISGMFSLSEPLFQLAVILAANMVVIAILLSREVGR
jgi:hypothetical protein